ncbi:MAG: hypothetical protein H6538_07395 [Bacteroidales bacterium]|nr:hypothetical protein [Bacteroidales bacterium]
MKSLKLLGIVILSLLILQDCEKDSPSAKNFRVNGHIQKGPFQIGGTVTLLELDNNLHPTGRSFYSTVSDKFGSFSFPYVELGSNYVELIADGFYYNENFGQVSTDRLILKAIADLSDSSTININILTHLTRDRLLYLIQDENETYSDAKKQAQDEVLAIFNLQSTDETDFEYLDISKSSELNSKLLAISSILQGYKSISSLTELLAGISLDIKEDGKLDSKEIQTEVISDAYLLNTDFIIGNLSNYYGDSSFNNFPKYCRQFTDSSEFQPLVKIKYPESVENEENLLSKDDNTMIQTGEIYILTHEIGLPENHSASFSVSIVKTSESGQIEFLPNDLTNWNYIDDYCSNDGTDSQIVLHCGILINCWDITKASAIPLKLKVSGSGTMRVTIYIMTDVLPYIGWEFGSTKNYSW